MHHKICRMQERSNVRRCAETERNAPVCKSLNCSVECARLSAVVQCDARPMSCCKCGNRLAGSSSAEDDDVNTA